MNMNNTVENFSKGERVNVEPMPNDLFDHPFTGYVVGFKLGNGSETTGVFVQVRDMDDDVWDCCPEQLSHNTDEIMHADSTGQLPED